MRTVVDGRLRRPPGRLVARCWRGAGRSLLNGGAGGSACVARAARGHVEVPARGRAVVAVVQVDVRCRGDHGAGPVTPLPVGYLALVRDEGDLDVVGGRGPAADRELPLGTAGVAGPGRLDLERQPEPLLLRTGNDDVDGHRAGVGGALRGAVPGRGEPLAHGPPGRAAGDAGRGDDHV